MAFITKEYFEGLQELRLCDRTDFSKMAIKSKQAKLRNGKGYSRSQFHNVVKRQFTTTEEVIVFVKAFYENKAKSAQSLNESLKGMQEILENSEI